jgi:hypothetical protein
MPRGCVFTTKSGESSPPLSGSPQAAQNASSSLMRVPHVPQNTGWISANPVFSPQCGQKCNARSIARVQCGHGAVRSERTPDGVVEEARRTSSVVETGRF